MKKFFIICLLGIALLASGYIILQKMNNSGYPYKTVENELNRRSHEPVLGIYDPESDHSQKEATAIKHYALILDADSEWKLDQDLSEALPAGDPVLLTVEMWGEGVLEKTAEGAYDEKLKDILAPIAEDQRQIYIRWNPEMEVPAKLYPWENNPVPYIRAFRRFSEITQEQIPRAKIVWGPAGYPGNMEFYPGKDFFSTASITINSDAENHTTLYKEETVPKQIVRKLHRMRFLNGPIFIMGSANLEPQEFKGRWVTDAIERFEQTKEETNFTNDLKESDSLKALYPTKTLVGLYDPHNLLVKKDAVSVEHLFVDFENIRDGSFKKDLAEVFSRDHDAIVSVEPWEGPEAQHDTMVLKNIIKGKYDETIRQLYRDIPDTDHTIYLRFAHEMEIPITRYPWQSKDPADYIKAFRYFMQFPRNHSADIKKVWGPAGDRGSLEWWPGNDVVDYVSIAIYGLPDKNITDPKDQETFATIFNRKMWRIRLLEKPVFITEFGVKGSNDFQKDWLLKAARVIKSDPRVLGISYFNMTDNPEAWGEIKPPDWSISEDTFDSFINALQNE